MASARPCLLSCSGATSRVSLTPIVNLGLAARPTRRNTTQCASQTSETADTNNQTIEGINRDYCNDFECTSSPAIESTVRSYARDLERCNGVVTQSLFSRNVEYKDTFRSFKGLEGYRRLNFIPQKLTKPAITVNKMKMLDTGTAELNWTLTGTIGPTPITVIGTTNIAMNLVTGQIEKHTESWDLSKCSPPATTAWFFNRFLWSVQNASQDAAAATNSVLDSLTSMDEGDNMNGFTQNPNDPMKYFQQKDSFKDDAIFFVGAVAVLYIVVQIYTKIL